MNKHFASGLLTLVVAITAFAAGEKFDLRFISVIVDLTFIIGVLVIGGLLVYLKFGPVDNDVITDKSTLGRQDEAKYRLLTTTIFASILASLIVLGGGIWFLTSLPLEATIFYGSLVLIFAGVVLIAPIAFVKELINKFD